MVARISFVAEQLASCAWYRCQVPGRALADAGYDVQVADWVNPDRLMSSDVIIFQRPSQPPIVGLIRQLVAAGKTVAVDMDDDLWNLHPTNPVYGAWKRPETISALEESIRAASLATAATPELARLMSRLNKNAVVLPNMLHREDWPTVLPEKDGTPLVVGWAGSPSHAPDLPQIAGVFETLLEKRDNVEVHIGGVPKDFFKSHPRLHVLPPVELADYPALIGDFDIGLAPLVDISFNRCKSDLKFLEYALVGATTIASDVAAYQRTIRHGETGLLVKSPKDWLKYITLLLDNTELRQKLRAQARAYAETRFSDANVGQWEKAYGLT
ncbi:MAG: glycosyltransferase family protein [Coriobacteriia bacterium]